MQGFALRKKLTMTKAKQDAGKINEPIDILYERKKVSFGGLRFLLELVYFCYFQLLNHPKGV